MKKILGILAIAPLALTSCDFGGTKSPTNDLIFDANGYANISGDRDADTLNFFGTTTRDFTNKKIADEQLKQESRFSSSMTSLDNTNKVLDKAFDERGANLSRNNTENDNSYVHKMKNNQKPINDIFTTSHLDVDYVRLVDKTSSEYLNSIINDLQTYSKTFVENEINDTYNWDEFSTNVSEPTFLRVVEIKHKDSDDKFYKAEFKFDNSIITHTSLGQEIRAKNAYSRITYLFSKENAINTFTQVVLNLNFDIIENGLSYSKFTINGDKPAGDLPSGVEQHLTANTNINGFATYTTGSSDEIKDFIEEGDFTKSNRYTRHAVNMEGEIIINARSFLNTYKYKAESLQFDMSLNSGEQKRNFKKEYENKHLEIEGVKNISDLQFSTFSNVTVKENNWYGDDDELVGFSYSHEYEEELFDAPFTVTGASVNEDNAIDDTVVDSSFNVMYKVLNDNVLKLDFKVDYDMGVYITLPTSTTMNEGLLEYFDNKEIDKAYYDKFVIG